MRTNLVLNDDLMKEAMRLGGARSKRALVEDALRTYIEVKRAERRREAYQERVRRLNVRLRDLQLRESPSCILRADRERP